MACPHSLIGEPRSCSQCRGAVPQIVTRDGATGIPLVNGKPVIVNGKPRPFALGPDEHQVAHYRRGAKASARSKRKL